MGIVKILVLPFLITCSTANANNSVAAASEAVELRLIQVLKDDVNGVDGLDNPRATAVTADNSRVFVVSGDDNAFAVFNLDQHFNLSFSQIFKNANPAVSGLEGASAVALLNKGDKAIVSSFYDGSLSVFSRGQDRYHLDKTISDGLSIRRVFGNKKTVGDLDTLGLLGAWELINTSDNKQLFVTDYKSNAVSVFDITPDKQVVFRRFITTGVASAGGLGNPTGLALSPSNKELFVLGFEEHKLTIFDRDKNGNLSAKQLLQNGRNGVEQFLNPQKIVVSPDGNFLYVACSSSHSLVVFKKAENGRYAFLQAISNKEIGGGLKGAGSLAVSSGGTLIYAAGEADTGLILFQKQADGQLKLISRLPNKDKPIDNLSGISSVNLTPDGRHLLLTAAEKDALFVFKVENK
ncbi:lactonase family protein [Thalassomonas actiniarum]|uniref:Beta-propeller fold lactonase family protein n=1 Tax=Thalassomonas actiniarum TaxID=485447 RepID=A0AAE9YXD6_9GAMM|nr:beta-propeller fold lactonase family protein [Thalassomonas actiniarum]WDE02658.1 beta-propeller fold lactonase family protein [Thalassomonas actiniarum]